MIKLLAIVLFTSSTGAAMACDEQCKAHEYYSDTAEMCLEKPAT